MSTEGRTGPATFAARRGVLGLRRISRFLGPEDESWGSLLALAVVVGLASGASGVALRSAVHALFHLLEGGRGGVVAVVVPAVGALVGVLIVARVFREPPGHGVPDVIRAVCRDGGRMRRRAAFSRWLGSMANVSAGGSAGLEGPIVYSGAAIGSAVGGAFRMDERRRSVLLACGVAGGISGVFNAPMTGMIFAMEVVLAEWSAFSIVPVIVSSVAGTELARGILGNERSFLHAHCEMGTEDLLACAVLGLVAGLVSVGLSRAIEGMHSLSGRLPSARYVAPVIGGLLVGAIGLIEPGAIGEGYGMAQSAIRSELPAGLALCAGLALAKLATSALTLGSGAPGGVFAPCLVLGSLVGAAFARAAHALFPNHLAVEGSYALVGMSGLVAGVMQAPLTGIFLVMEVTGGYEVILPLMIVSVVSLLVARRFERYSMYTRELAETGDLLRPGTDRRILADVRVRETLDEDVVPVREDMTLADFVGVIRRSRRNHFPVLAADSEDLVGMLELGPLRELLLDPELARVTLVGTVMDPAPDRLPITATLAEALERFEETGQWVLPVVDGTRFSGLLSKSTLFDHYRRELSAQTG